MTAVALAGFLASANIPEAPTWRGDYQSARQAVIAEGKPMAVFLGKGAAADLGLEARQILASKYVCVYANVDTAEGQKLAKSFEMGTGVVISDRTGKLQAFRHEGDLGADELKARLVKYADADHVVRSTETVAPAGTTLAYASCPGGVCGVAVGGYAVAAGCSGGSCGVAYAGGCAGGSCGGGYSGGCSTGGCGHAYSSCGGGSGGGCKSGCGGGRGGRRCR
jgi:hypothetical protein